MRMSRRRFTELTRQAYGELPPAIAARLENLDIIVADAPGPEAEGATEDAGGDGGDGGGLLGLYVGVPLTERYGDGTGAAGLHLYLPAAHSGDVRHAGGGRRRNPHYPAPRNRPLSGNGRA